MLNCVRTIKNKQDRYRTVAEKHNRRMAGRFEATPFAARVTFVPHCMRAAEGCKAKEVGPYYICAECGRCKIGAINRKARELGYKGTFILKGGRSIEKIIAELKPAAILGVACWFEGAQAFDQTEGSDIAVQFVALSKDGCAATDVDLNEVFQKMSAAR